MIDSKLILAFNVQKYLSWHEAKMIAENKKYELSNKEYNPFRFNCLTIKLNGEKLDFKALSNEEYLLTIKECINYEFDKLVKDIEETFSPIPKIDRLEMVYKKTSDTIFTDINKHLLYKAMNGQTIEEYNIDIEKTQTLEEFEDGKRDRRVNFESLKKVFIDILFYQYLDKEIMKLTNIITPSVLPMKKEQITPNTPLVPSEEKIFLDFNMEAQSVYYLFQELKKHGLIIDSNERITQFIKENIKIKGKEIGASKASIKRQVSKIEMPPKKAELIDKIIKGSKK